MEKFKKNLEFIFLVTLVVLAAVIWYAVFYLESHQNLSVTFFDVGQGDAIFIQTKNGNQILIDGGPDDSILAKLGREMPFWDRSIDAVILTHPDKDHIAGLVEVLKRYDVGIVFWTGVMHSNAEYDEWKKLLAEKEIPVFIVKNGQKMVIGDGIVFHVLAPFENFEGRASKKINNTAIVGRLEHGSNSFLFTADIEKSVEHRLLFEAPDLINVDILKVAHHGSKTSSIEEFLRAVSPELAVIQVGRKNRYGHPTQEVLGRLSAIGAKVLRNDLNGDTKIESNGVGYWLAK